MAHLAILSLTLLAVHPLHSQSIACRGDCKCPSAASGSTCTLNCIGKEQCKDATLECRAGDPCIINCDGSNSCEGNTRIDGQSATDVTVTCSGEDACKGNTRILCGSKHCDISCTSSTSCIDTRVDAQDTWKLSCSGSCSSIQSPFARPTAMPTISPTLHPSTSPTTPTLTPTQPPSVPPTTQPSVSPTKSPSDEPTRSPTTELERRPVVPTSIQEQERDQAVANGSVTMAPNPLLLGIVTALLICCCALCVVFCWFYQTQKPRRHEVQMSPELTFTADEAIADIVDGVEPLELYETNGMAVPKDSAMRGHGEYLAVHCETADDHVTEDVPPLPLLAGRREGCDGKRKAMAEVL